MEMFFNSLQQTLILFCFMAIGYTLRKTGILPSNSGSTLSKLEVYIFLPFLTFRIFATQLNMDNINAKAPILLIALIVIACLLVISFPLSRIFAKERYQRHIYYYSFTVANYGYMGYALMGLAFGEEMLLDMMIFALPFSFFIHTVGIYILMPQGKMSFKRLLNPIFIALFAGCAAGLLEIPLPGVILSIAKSASDCMAPAAMLLTGIIIAGVSFKSLVSEFKILPASILRLIVIPGITLLILTFAGVSDRIIVITGMMLAMPMGLNTIIFPEAFGEDSLTGARLAFVSSALGLVTIPFVLTYLGTLNI